MSAITIMLADDHQIIRDGLRAVLNAEPDFMVTGEASDGLQVADMVERLRPHVLVLDVMMPGLNGLDVARQVVQRNPKTRVLILSMYSNEAYILAALRNGAAGYVLKSASADSLIEAIRLVMRGQRYLSPPLTERAIEAYIEKAASAPLDVYETLTSREREVLHLVAQGQNSAQIAETLTISRRTVDVHRARIMQKLDLHSPTDMLRFALQRGIIPLETAPDLPDA
jgi:DNA-binding NarL/FixJ family response regulator